jgi:hypothetical protein
MAKTGLTLSIRELQESLGNLYSVPSDARIPLVFERNNLRLKCHSKEIEKYLKQLREFFEELSSVQGGFRVSDFDELGNRVDCNWENCGRKDKDENTPEEKHTYWRAAQPSLLAERDRVRIAPGTVPLSISTHKLEYGTS